MAYQYRGHEWDVTGEEPGGAEKILSAAIDLYGRHGFDHVTLKDIAAAAGVSAPLVIHHFGSSAGLREACDRNVADAVNRSKMDTVQQGHLPRNYMMELMHSQKHLLLYLFRAFAAGGDDTDRLFDQLVDDSLVYTAAGEELGLVYPSSDPHRRAVVMLVQSFGALLLHRQIKRHLGVDPVEGPPEDLGPYTAALVELYTRPLLNADVYANLMEMAAYSTADDTNQAADRPESSAAATTRPEDHPADRPATEGPPS